MKQVIIYTAFTSKRLEYIFDFIWKNVFGLDYIHTLSKEEFSTSALLKINYSDEPLDAHFTIMPHLLLTETTFTKQSIDVFDWQHQLAFFKTSNQEIPFDIFSASFYLISRYEEYLPYTPDLYHRYPHTDSLAFQFNFLHLPLVDMWLYTWKNLIQKIYPSLVFSLTHFLFTPTYDIDIAYSFKHKGLQRSVGGLLKDIIHGRVDDLVLRTQVLINKKQDPYDCYIYLDELHKKYELEPIYFFLVGKYGEFDKNISIENKAMQILIQTIGKNYSVGIHPSYQSNNDTEIVKQEIQSLSNTLQHKIVSNRQHYIRFTLPYTYEFLIAQGIEHDYSMGYGSINGFRASTSHPFFYFNVKENKVTTLQIHPFCFMEANSFYEQKYTAEEALEELMHYAAVTKKVNGHLITIWHNFSLGSDLLWLGWKEIYESFIKQIH